MKRYLLFTVFISGMTTLAAELAAVGLQASRYAQLVNVYQAMGGGWVEIASESAQKPLGNVTARSNP